MIESSRMPAMRNMPPYSRVSRMRMVGRSQGKGGSTFAPGFQVGFGGALGGAGAAAIEGSDPVAGAGHRDDDRGLAELAAQGHDGDAYDVGERVRVLVPGLLQELLGGDDCALAAQQYFQDGELLGGELDL